MKMEYDFLFRSLFNEAIGYKRVVETLARKMKGMTRQELVDELKITDNGRLTVILDNLCNSDFLRKYSPYGKRQKGMLYQLTDLYTLFYLRFVNAYQGANPNAWSQMESGAKNAWSGYAFEQVCLCHIPQLRKALGISAISNDICSWYGRTEEQTAQIDLIIDRADGIMNLCEMKFSTHSFEITKDYAEHLRERMGFFADMTRTRKTLHLTMVTTYGLKRNKYAGVVQNEIDMEQLFE